MVAKRYPLPLGLKAGTGQSALASGENLINLYPEIQDGKPHLLGIPGQTAFSTIGGTKRGQFYAGDTHFAVRGEALYIVDTDGLATLRGTIAGTARCDFAYDGRYLHIVADITSYTYELSSGTLLAQTDAEFERASSVCVVSNVPVFSRAGTGEIAWSSLTDGRAFDGLDFANAETSPDQIKAVRESAQELVLFGTDTTEFWRFTGNSDQYFEASGSAAALGVGTHWRDSIKPYDNTLAWLATNREGALYVAKLAGAQASRISNHAVETSLEKASAAALANAFGFSYTSRGHAFYGITVPDHCTWVTDAATGGEWHQRLAGNWPITTPEIPVGDWGVRDLVVNEDRKVILGKNDGNLWALDYDSYSADGLGICRELITPPFSLGGMSFSVSEVELICKTGVGLASGDGSLPYVQMSFSDDGGQTWEDAYMEELGPLGNYGWGVRFTRLGRCPGPKGRRFRFRATDAVEFTPIEAFITIEGGTR